MSEEKATSGFVKAAFGAKNRSRLIDLYFDSSAKDANGFASPLFSLMGSSTQSQHVRIQAATAWEHVYKLLLWADQTTGLAHCYESDKSQPGKNWYSRSLAFHDWVSRALKCSPDRLASEIDWLFRKATADLATDVLRKAQAVAAAAAKQRAPFEKRNLPKPGEDPELIAIVREVLGVHLVQEPANDTWQTLVQRIRQYLALENKRKNLVGEGFEDVLGQVIQRTCAQSDFEVGTRRLLHDIPGFNRVRRGEKANKVDIALVRPSMRTLITAKWSVRADREKQFAADFSDYLTAESDGSPFEYVFVTNEFDPARLIRACEKLAGNAQMFTHVVHISTDAVKATYGPSEDPTMRRVIDSIDKGRLISLGAWLDKLQVAATKRTDK